VLQWLSHGLDRVSLKQKGFVNKKNKLMNFESKFFLVTSSNSSIGFDFWKNKSFSDLTERSRSLSLSNWREVFGLMKFGSEQKLLGPEVDQPSEPLSSNQVSEIDNKMSFFISIIFFLNFYFKRLSLFFPNLSAKQGNEVTRSQPTQQMAVPMTNPFFSVIKFVNKRSLKLCIQVSTNLVQ